MKKLFVLTLLLIFPLSVFAAEEKPKVLTLNAKAEDAVINYDGTTEEGSHAVMCKLYDKDSEEVDKLSVAVNELKFEGSFTVNEKGKYTVYCANYEGGEIKNVEVEVTSINKSNPKTADNLALYITLGVVSIAGISALVIALNKRKKAK